MTIIRLIHNVDVNGLRLFDLLCEARQHEAGPRSSLAYPVGICNPFARSSRSYITLCKQDFWTKARATHLSAEMTPELAKSAAEG